MYKVEILTDDDYIKCNKPQVYMPIRTVSITTGRIIITDSDNHMYNFNPVHVKALRINVLNGGVYKMPDLNIQKGE